MAYTVMAYIGSTAAVRELLRAGANPEARHARTCCGLAPILMPGMHAHVVSTHARAPKRIYVRLQGQGGENCV